LTSDLPHPGPQLSRKFASRREGPTRRRGWWPFG
jgi:hypothetical protein